MHQHRGPAASAASLRAHRQELFAQLEGLSGGLPWDPRQFNPYPFVLPEAALGEMTALCHAIAAGIRAVVEGYAADVRIRERLALDPGLADLAERLAGEPFALGTFRPDFVIDTAGRPRVCEINARFSANGFVISYLMNEALSRVSYLPRSLRAVAAMETARAELRRDLDDGRAIALVMASEKGSEIHHLLAGLPVAPVAPADLALGEGGAVTAHGRSMGAFVLELDRAELLSIDRAALLAMVESGRCRNDPRSSMLVHDKRLLSLLGDDAVMANHLDAPARALLARHVIPTFPATDPAAHAAALARPEEWVLKPSHGGRGVGVLIGREAPAAAWQARLGAEAARHCLQRYVPQASFPILHLRDEALEETAMNVVGLLPCFGEHVFGPGIFRASSGSVINVHQSRGEVLPCAIA